MQPAVPASSASSRSRALGSALTSQWRTSGLGPDRGWFPHASLLQSEHHRPVPQINSGYVEEGWR